MLNKSGTRIEPCGATDFVFSHELQKQFTFAICFVSFVLYGLAGYSKATLLCLIVWESEIVRMGCGNLSKSLKERMVFSSQNLVKIGKDKVNWVGTFV